MKTISAKRLELADACKDQVALFRSEWGDKCVPLTHANWDRAGEIGLDRLWMMRLLRGAARDDYYKACAAALDDYYKACAAARDDYYKACAAALDDYYKACAAALFAALTGGVDK